MSDPGTNVEIEDVLSSIRRLVSQDAAMQPASAVHRSAPVLRAEKAPEPEAALLLTPAQRIAPEPVAETVSPEDAPDAPVKPDVLVLHPAQDLGEELSRLESTIAEMEAAVVDTPEEFEPEHGDPFEPEGAEPLAELPDAFDEAVFAAQINEEPAAAPIWEDATEEALALADTPEAAQPPMEAADVAQDPETELAAWEADLTAEIAAADTEAPDAWPGLTEARMVAAVSPAAAAMHASEAAFNSSRPPERGEETNEALDLSAALAMSEDDLRALIAEIVRQELQGTLGERITRNVRKLVRREIHRVLGTEDS